MTRHPAQLPLHYISQWFRLPCKHTWDACQFWKRFRSTTQNRMDCTCTNMKWYLMIAINLLLNGIVLETVLGWKCVPTITKNRMTNLYYVKEKLKHIKIMHLLCIHGVPQVSEINLNYYSLLPSAIFWYNSYLSYWGLLRHGKPEVVLGTKITAALKVTDFRSQCYSWTCNKHHNRLQPPLHLFCPLIGTLFQSWRHCYGKGLKNPIYLTSYIATTNHFFF